MLFSQIIQEIIGNNSSINIWQKRGDRNRPDLVPSKVNSNFQVMIWGWIFWNGVGTLAKVTGYFNLEKYNEIPEENIWPVIDRHFPDNQYFFQDDNALVHRSRVLQEYSDTLNLINLKWVATWDFQQCGMCDQQNFRSACAYAQSDQSLCWSLKYSLSVKLLTEYHLEFLSLTGSYTGSSESTLVKIPHCWKSHVTSQIHFLACSVTWSEYYRKYLAVY